MRLLTLTAVMLGAIATAPAIAAPTVPQPALAAILQAGAPQQDSLVEQAQYRISRREAIRRQEFRRRQAIRRQQFNRRQVYRRY